MSRRGIGSPMDGHDAKSARAKLLEVVLPSLPGGIAVVGIPVMLDVYPPGTVGPGWISYPFVLGLISAFHDHRVRDIGSRTHADAAAGRVRRDPGVHRWDSRQRFGLGKMALLVDVATPQVHRTSDAPASARALTGAARLVH